MPEAPAQFPTLHLKLLERGDSEEKETSQPWQSSKACPLL